MKKTGLFKIIMFILLGMVVATWIFSAGYFNETEVVAVDMYNVGFFDFFALIIGAFEFEYFIQILILLVSIGALYGVLNKTGKYRAWIEKIAKNMKGQELVFLIVVAFVITALTTMFDYEFSLFIFFPLLISIILAMGYDKVTAALTTFGSVLIGTIGNIKGDTVTSTIIELLDTEMTTNMLYFKLALAFLSFIALIFFLSKAKRTRKTAEDLENEDRFIGEKVSTKYSAAPIIIAFALMFVILVLACTNWSDTFGIKFFENLHNSITTAEIKLPYFHIAPDGIDAGTQKVAIFSKILGTFSAFGKWHFIEMAILCLFTSVVLGLIYRIKGIFQAMADGAKKMLAPAFMVLFAYTVIYFAGSQMFYPTIAAIILSISSKFSVILSTIVVGLGSTLFVDILYVANYLIPQISAISGATPTLVTLLIQGVYGVTMFVAPTSALLVLALTYLEIPYKEWIKRTWKLILVLLAIVVGILLIAKFI